MKRFLQKLSVRKLLIFFFVGVLIWGGITALLPQNFSGIPMTSAQSTLDCTKFHWELWNACYSTFQAEDALAEARSTGGDVAATEEAYRKAREEFQKAIEARSSEGEEYCGPPMTSEEINACTARKAAASGSEEYCGPPMTNEEIEACEARKAPKDKKTVDEQTIDIGKLLSFIVSAFTPLIAILVNLIGKLMGTEVIYGSLGSGDHEKFQQILHIVWLVIRDLVNYVFIIVLLAIAFMSVFGAANPENNNFEIKKMLPKFILAVVAVNFTWFGARVVLDVANVVTHIVYAIPKTLIAADIDLATEGDKTCAGDEENKLWRKNCIPLAAFARNGNTQSAKVGLASIDDFKEVTDGVEARVVSYYDDLSAEKKGEVKAIEDTGVFIVLWGNFSWEKFQQNSIAALFAYNVLQIQNLPQAVEETAKDGIDIENLAINALFAILFMVLIIVAYVVMAVVLLERVIVIWINIILSPIAALMPFASDFGLEGGGSETVGIKPFMKMAFFPAMMGLPLTLGYILIAAGQNITGSTEDGTLQFETELINGVHTMHHLLWYIMAIVCLWYSTQIASDFSIHMKGLVDGITDKVKAVGSFLGKSPIYWQFIPIAKNEGAEGEEQKYVSLPAIGRLLDRAKSSRSQEVEADTDSLVQQPDPTPTIKRLYGSDKSMREKHADYLDNAVAAVGTDPKKIIDYLERSHPDMFRDLGVNRLDPQHLTTVVNEMKANQADLLSGKQHARRLIDTVGATAPGTQPGGGGAGGAGGAGLVTGMGKEGEKITFANGRSADVGPGRAVQFSEMTEVANNNTSAQGLQNFLNHLKKEGQYDLKGVPNELTLDNGTKVEIASAGGKFTVTGPDADATTDAG